MKTMKKLTALVVALVMAMAMAVTTFGATITAPSNGHTYEVYQVITGDLSNGKLSNMKWGANANKTGDVSKEDADKIAAISGERADVASEIAKYATLSNPVATLPVKTEGSDPVLSAELPDGYYIIVDKGPAGENETLSLNLVKVAGKVTITPKAGTVDFEKKVKDANDTEGIVTEWQDSADHDLGDEIPFKLEATIADNFADFETYYLAFHDVEEKGLEFQGITSVTIDGKPVDSTKYEVKTPGTTCEEGCTFEVIFNELKGIAKAGDKVVVEYTSKLTSDAVLGQQGNVNKAKAEYSNNPNDKQGGKPSTDETPWDNVIVFTYKVVVDKVEPDTSDDAEEGATKPLAGAAFSLFKIVPDTSDDAEEGATKEVLVKAYEAGDTTTFEFSHLDDGQYVLKETVTPPGYNSVADMTFTVTADHKVVWDGTNRTDVLTTLNGNRVSGEITLTANKTDGTLTSDVVNKSGSTLPETGGMGTTVIYVVGAILVLGAGVLLITRRRVAR